MLTEILTAENLIALGTLTALEIVLGIDNVVFIAILVEKLPHEQRAFARRLGLGLAMFVRIGLLFMITWIMHLTKPWFSIGDHPISGRDIILILGGLFLIGKATFEIHHKLEDTADGAKTLKRTLKFGAVIIQILLIDIVFSLDSVITAVGMAQALWVMVTAIVVAVLVMLLFAKAISDFIEKHPTLKVLALSFLLLIGVMLVAEGFGQHIERGYIYFAMGFSLLVETINIRVRRTPAVTG